jgi:stearoyl-CoA desaturase (delta-9 desaturase)
VPLTVLGLALLAAGAGRPHFVVGYMMVLWAIFLRVTVGQHVTWMVNSVTHVWGARRFPTRDDSRNNWLVALLSFGEGWHNNHHAHPVSARHGLAWYELDITYWTIRLLGKLGLIRTIKTVALDTTGPAAQTVRQAA